MSHFVEIQSGVLRTYDGEEIQVHGGAYLHPDGLLSTHAEIEKLRNREPPLPSVPIILGAALLGLTAGYLLGRRGSED